MLLGGLAYLGVRTLSLGYLPRPSESAIQAGSLLQHALLVVKSLGSYARVILWPFTSLAPIHFSSLPVPAGESSAWILLLLLALLAYRLSLLLRSRRASARQAGWLALAGILSLLPVANLLPLELGGRSFIADALPALPNVPWGS